MIRLFNAYIPKRTLLLLISESALIILALYASVLLLGDSASDALSYPGYWKVALVGAVCLMSIYYCDLYDPAILSNPREVRSRLMQGLGTACLVMAALYFVLPSSQVGRGFVIIGISLIGVLLVLHRQMFFALNSSHRFAETAVILGDGPFARSLATEIQTRPELGLRLVGYAGTEWEPGLDAHNTRYLGGMEVLTELAKQMRIERIIVALGDRRNKLPINELLHLKTSGIMIQEGADFYEISTGKLPVDTLRLSWLVFSPGFQVSKGKLLYKRVFSFVMASVAIVLLFPVMVLVALAIRLNSPGPVIFRQARIGKDGQPFRLYKFRTLYENADSGGDPLPVQENDKRVTKVGHWLRQFRLDEIPQLYNILLGQMHFVGPRPFVPNQEMELAQQIPLYTQRWTVRPGATGWAQIHRGYCASLEDNYEKLAYDLFYIKNMSMSLDLLILFRTMKIVLLGRGGR